MNRTAMPWIALLVTTLAPLQGPRSQMVWKEASPRTRPASRAYHSMVFDTARSRIVMFGGLPSDLNQLPRLYADTWEYDGTSWTQNTLPFARPPARAAHAMAYDRARSRVVMFAGSDGRNILADTWEYDGIRWQLRTPRTSPPGLVGHQMVFDTARNVTVLFGGNTSSSGRQFSGDTWEWDGTDWRRRTLGWSPSGRINHSMTFDTARGVVVLFGGSDANATVRDTWEWDGTALGWVNVSGPSAPPGTVAKMVFDEDRERAIWMGTQQGPARGLPDLWEWDGLTWVRGNNGDIRPLRLWPALAYDSARKRVVLFSGMNTEFLPNDTWEYYPTNRGRASSVGTGCAGSAGVPVLGAVGAPIRGNRMFRVSAEPVRATALAFLVLTRNGVNIPINGCTLRVDAASSHVLLVGTTTSTGRFVTGLPIPANPALSGIRVIAQAFVQDNRGALFGALAMTNGLLLDIGD